MVRSAVVFLALVAACGEADDGVGRRSWPITAYCSATVTGVGERDVETDYLPHVVQCENGAADIEALRAQAVAARTFLYYKLETAGAIGDGQGDQVYSCSRTPAANHVQAVADTVGVVLTYHGDVTCSFYVAGATQTPPGCQGNTGASTEHYVTYNDGLSGDAINQSTLGWVDPSNYRNRGCMSQNGAQCLESAGRDWQQILRFYYGADIGIETAVGSCVPVQQDAGAADAPTATDSGGTTDGGAGDGDGTGDGGAADDATPGEDAGNGGGLHGGCAAARGAPSQLALLLLPALVAARHRHRLARRTRAASLEPRAGGVSMRHLLAVTLLLALTGCQGAIENHGDAGQPGLEAGQEAGPGPDGGGDGGPPVRDGGTDAVPEGQLGTTIRVNHFGWRPGDRKIAVLLGSASATVEARRAIDNSVAGAYTASTTQTDDDSSDSYSTVDFSALTEVGDYYLLLPGANERSYGFSIAPDVYDIVGLAAVKSYYYQRCNHDRALPYASDAIGGFPGLGGQWVDGACHTGDSSLAAGPGSANNGTLDLHGGWHDAGDYQKTLWGRGVPEMLFAYEINPGAWSDDQLNLPESGNGIPDLLDEVRWELDFYVRMQRPDGHFMTSAKGHNSTVASPPSASDEERVYFDCTSPDGGGWSGGGVTIGEATGNAVLSLAHAAIVFRAIGQNAIADGYQAAATSGWGWLNGQTPADAGERRVRAAAAAAVYRMDNAQASAKAVAEGFAWSTWDGMLSGSATPGESLVGAGAWHMLLNAGAASGVKSSIRTAAAQVYVEGAFAEEGAYGGMFGGPGNGWDYSWGSNRSQGSYGANLLMAVHFGILGSHAEADVRARAEKHFHYLLGLNPLHMVYLTNMAAYGGEHSSFQIYHSWFSYTGSDGDHGNAQFNGKPAAVVEPLYPYHPSDTQTSTYGPAPGIVPGGPNAYYGGSYDIPNLDRPAYAYRDFSVGCDWDGATCRAASWEITEPMQAYQGPFVLLASFMMSSAD